MSAQILYGKPAADAILEEIRPYVATMSTKLVIVQVGDNAASSVYIRTKMQKAAEIGMKAEHIHLPETCSSTEMLELIYKLNDDASVHGYIIQLPLPAHLRAVQPQLFRAINPAKDVDGFTAYNLGKLLLSTEFEHLPPATPAGIVKLLEYANVALRGVDVCIVGQSNIVGKPLSIMLLNRGATVTMCHADTRDLAAHTKRAAIVVSAVGKADLLETDHIQEGAVVIDVGMNETPHGLRGDVHPDVANVASMLTPVPGGVGPMTVACLLQNCVTASQRQH